MTTPNRWFFQIRELHDATRQLAAVSYLESSLVFEILFVNEKSVFKDRHIIWFNGINSSTVRVEWVIVDSMKGVMVVRRSERSVRWKLFCCCESLHEIRSRLPIDRDAWADPLDNTSIYSMDFYCSTYSGLARDCCNDRDRSLNAEFHFHFDAQRVHENSKIESRMSVIRGTANLPIRIFSNCASRANSLVTSTYRYRSPLIRINNQQANPTTFRTKRRTYSIKMIL